MTMPLGVLPVDDNPINVRLAQAFLAISGIEYDVCVRHGAGAPTRRFTNVFWAFVNKLPRHSHHPMPAGRMTERVP
jgi:hypothetical protein